MKKILIIEDEITLRQNLLELLNAEDFYVVGAENGRIGVQLAQEVIPDLIICDIMMPELDGYSVLASLREDQVTATIPFIFLTAKSDKSEFRKGMELGADDYLTKPFTMAQLLGAIATRLEKQAVITRHSQKQLDRLRSSITMSLPHEMRTPLNGILGFAQLLTKQPEMLQPQDIKDMGEGIKNSAERLLRIIQNFLLYAELEIIASDSQRLKTLQNQETPFPTESVIYIINKKAKQVNREADITLDLQPATIKIAEYRLCKIIEELIDNALKFSPSGTLIQVTSRCINNTFTLSFIDCGRGMTADQIADLGAYRQFERKLYEQQGTGLGLTISKRLAELHGGELHIESKPEEKTIVQVILSCDMSEEW